MATLSANYTAAASLTITLTSLADGAYRQSAEVTNAANLYLDAHLGGSIQAGTVGADGSIIIYGYGSYDATNHSGGVGTTDAGITWGTTGNTSIFGYRQLVLLAAIQTDSTDDDNDLYWGPVSVASAFGGVLPTKWGIVVLNNTGAALHATGTNNEVQFMGIKYDSA